MLHEVVRPADMDQEDFGAQQLLLQNHLDAERAFFDSQSDLVAGNLEHCVADTALKRNRYDRALRPPRVRLVIPKMPLPGGNEFVPVNPHPYYQLY